MTSPFIEPAVAVNTLVGEHTGRSKKVLSPKDLFASFSYQAGEVVLYVVDELICKNVESALRISYLVVEE